MRCRRYLLYWLLSLSPYKKRSSKKSKRKINLLAMWAQKGNLMVDFLTFGIRNTLKNILERVITSCRCRHILIIFSFIWKTLLIDNSNSERYIVWMYESVYSFCYRLILPCSVLCNWQCYLLNGHLGSSYSRIGITNLATKLALVKVWFGCWLQSINFTKTHEVQLSNEYNATLVKI